MLAGRLIATIAATTLIIIGASAQQIDEQIFKREDYIIFKDLNVDWSEGGESGEGGEKGENGEKGERSGVSQSSISAENTLSKFIDPYYDLYGDLILYYKSAIDINRRGVKSWLLKEYIGDRTTAIEPLTPTAERAKVRLSGSMERYNIGIYAAYNSNINSSNAIESSIDWRSGRDLFVDGLFSNQLRGNLMWSHKFSDKSYLTTSLYAPYVNGSQRGGVNDEVVTLTSDPLYNNAWGYYNGEVRSSKIDTYALPKFESRYQHELTPSTTFASELSARYGVSSRSQLGWYDAYNPYPDYYRNLPSYIQNESSHTTVERAWQSGDSDYTQINWDQLVWINQISSDGESHYVMESRVRRVTDIELDAIASSALSSRFTLSYGGGGSYNSTRSYKRLDDLLGGDYLLNNDQYIGDYENLDINMDNDLRNPNRKIECGDRFGYDYTLATIDYSLLMALNYKYKQLSIELSGELGSQSVQRVGHYEKERFAGSLSYGSSSTIELPNNSFSYSVDYDIDRRNSVSLSGTLLQLPTQSYDLFIQPEYANIAITNPCSSTNGEVTARYDLSRVGLHLSVEAFYNWSNNVTDIIRYYDDLSYTYTNAVVSEIDTRGVGVEVALAMQINRVLRLENTLSIGRYRYSDAPLVSLYDDSDLTLYSVSRANAIEGCAIAETASLYSTTQLSLSLNRGWMVSTQMAISTGRYVDPSFVRRTDRVVSSLLSSGLTDEVVEQEQLSNMYDLSLSVMRTIYMGGDRGSLTLYLRLENALGISDLEQSGRESNRTLYSSGGSTTGLRYLQPNSYTYVLPRRIYLSCTYNF